MLSWRQIEAFRAVMLTRSMTGAAEMLAVTQPAISRLVKDLEQEVKFTLFTRRRGGLVPSAGAMALYAEVQHSFSGLDRIGRAAHRFRNKQAGALRIACFPALTLTFLPQVIREFASRHDGVSIALHTHNSPDGTDLVRAQHYDLGLTMTPTSEAGVIVGPVLRSWCVCIMPPDHELTKKDVISLKDFRDQPFISLAEDTTTRFKIDSAFRAANIERRLEMEARWSAVICNMVSLGLGLSIIEPFTASSFAGKGLEVRPINVMIDFSFATVMPLGKEESPLLAEFIACMNERLKFYLIDDPGDLDDGGEQRLDDKFKLYPGDERGST
ncbi:transcriptional regulator [Skermanella aerolata]|uniref:Transcriptional regulator n=1 Tax=Skermanella aerolata TaxID=393310 RepID=A0A512DIY9_9PROT|nr:LysR substrate-binding domain-containing protein [Skermanella aerolata]GEO36447.1 transcriptional regulator [Skermanella aerolata]